MSESKAGAEVLPVAWGIFDSQGFYEACLDQESAKRFCDHYNKRLKDPLKPYTFGPLYAAPADGEAAELAEWMKDGETVLERLKREQRDVLSALDLLARERGAIAELQRELAEARRDAERYRWLRDPGNQEAPGMVAYYSPDGLDSAIDAARGEKKE